MKPAGSHLLLLAGPGGTQLDRVLRSVKDVTSHVSVAAYNPSRNDMSTQRATWEALCEGEWSEVSTREELDRAAHEIDGRRPIAGVATFTEVLLAEQAMLQDALGLPGNSPESVRTSQSKYLQRCAMRRAGVVDMRFAAVHTADDLAPAAHEVGFPAILKPAYSSSSFHVTRVDDIDQLERAYASGVSAYVRSPLSGPDRLFVLEQFLVGESWYADERLGDYCSVESLICDGRIHHLAVMDKLRLQQGFVEEGDIVPTVLSGSHERDVLRHATDVIRAVGLTNGAVHTEIKLTAAGPVCLEINARLGGATGHVLSTATDIDVVAEVMRVALGTAPGPQPRMRRTVFPTPNRRVRLVAAPTPEQIRRRHPAVRYCRMRYELGTILDPAEPGNLVTLLVDGPDLDGCLEKIDALTDDLLFTFEDAPRLHVCIADRVGYDRYRGADGIPVLGRDEYDVTLITAPADRAQARRGECERVIEVDTDDEQRLVEAVRDLHRRRPISRLLAFSERHILPMAVLRDELGIPGQRPAAAQLLRDKLAMKAAVAAHGIRVPESMPICSPLDAEPLLGHHDAVVLKPRLGTGSEGVSVVRTMAELAELALANRDWDGYEAEEFIAGPMFHVDSVRHRGRPHMVSVARYLAPTTGFADGQPLLAVMESDAEVLAAVEDFAEAVHRAVDVDDGVTHLECFRTASGELVFCEIAGRAGGGAIVPLVRAVHGVDLFEAMQRAAVGLKPPPRRPGPHPCAGYAQLYSGGGRIEAIHEPPAARSPWVLASEQSAAVGESPPAPRMVGNSILSYVVGGPTAATVERRLHALARGVRLECADA
jgi:biotin carboxylase